VVNKNTLIKIAIIVTFIAPLLLAHYSGLGEYLNVASLKANKEALHAFVAKHYMSSVFYYILLYILVGALSFPFISLLIIAGGFLFGTPCAMLYTNIGATIGGAIAFLAYRYLFGPWVHEYYGHRLVTFNQEIARNGAWYLVMIRLIAVIPFFVANAFASVAPISLKTFLWTTSLGIIPASLVYSFAGEQLDTISSLRDVFSMRVIGAFVLLLLLTVVSVLIRHYRIKKETI
jgi:uncharacterized membrane protein YdjX (TVP38/TMEM64 family)